MSKANGEKKDSISKNSFFTLSKWETTYKKSETLTKKQSKGLRNGIYGFKNKLKNHVFFSHHKFFLLWEGNCLIEKKLKFSTQLYIYIYIYIYNGNKKRKETWNNFFMFNKKT
jgi:hypothetical protein